MNNNEITSPTSDISLATELGKNYQYMKSIVSNKLEIKKLEILENVSSATSAMVIGIISAFFISMIFLFLSVAVVLIIAQSLGSYIQALFIVAGFILFLMIITLFFGKGLIKNIIEGKMLNATEKKAA